MSRNKIFIRVDSGTKIGYGHLIRCLALAEYLRKHYEIIFISSGLPGNIINELIQKKFKIFRLKSHSGKINQNNDAEKTISLVKKYGGKENLMIVDSYELSKRWETSIRPHFKKLIVIDDLNNRRHNCDVIIDQNLHTEMNRLYDELVPKHCTKLLGPKYAMIRDQFVNLRKSSKIRKFPITRILISFGGTDIENQTISLLEIIKKSNLDIRVDVIVGKSNLNKNNIKKICDLTKGFYYFEQTRKIAKLMQSADLSIGSGGSTNWERCSLGLPAIVSIVSDDQMDVTQALSQKKYIISLGIVKKIKDEDYVSAILSFNKEKLCQMSQKCFRLVDGRGKERISKYILSIFNER